MQIAALRKAETLSFHHHAKNNASFIRATKRYREGEWRQSSPFRTSEDAYLEIPCAWRLTDYTRGDENKIPYGSDQFNAFEMIHAAQSERAWSTTASLLRVGDKLTLLWERGGWTTEAMEKATPHFFGDTLHLQVDRGDKRLCFHVRTSICEDNSARMVRRG